MSLYAIGDPHLSFGVSKPMDIFPLWRDHEARLESAWRAAVRPEDTVVIAGDVSWGAGLSEALPDFQWLDALPGERKILLKGNHDFWWTTGKKMTDFFTKNNLNTLKILHNNFYEYGSEAICGTRGWVNTPQERADTESDRKISLREAQRLETSLKAAAAAGLSPIVFLHYPPIYGASCNLEILRVLWDYSVRECYYGHIHGEAQRAAINGERDGVRYRLIAGDFVGFEPQKVR